MVTDTRDEIKKAIIANREEPPTGSPMGEELSGAPATKDNGAPATKDLQDGIETSAAEASAGTAMTKGTGAAAEGGTGTGQAQTVPGSQIDPERLRESIKDSDERLRATIPIDQQIKIIKDRAAQLAPEDEETRKKRERRERSKRIIGAVSDGLRALGNLYFTSQYAPDMYKGSTRQLDKANELIERAKAQRDKDADEYFNLSMKIGDKEAEKAKTLRDLEAQQEARKLAREAAAQKKQAHEAAMRLNPFKERKAEAEAGEKEAKRKRAESDAEYAPKLNAQRLDNEGKKGKVYDSQVEKNRAQAVKAWKEGKKPFHFDGKEYYKDNENDYMKAITSAVEEVNNYFAKRDSSGKIVRDSRGDVVYRDDYEPLSVAYDNLNAETKYYAWAETAGKAEQALEKMRKEQKVNAADNTPPSRRKQNKDDNTPPSRR